MIVEFIQTIDKTENQDAKKIYFSKQKEFLQRSINIPVNFIC